MFYIDRFFFIVKFTIEESRLYVYLLNLVIFSYSDREERLIAYRLYYRGVGFEVIVVLYKTLYYLTTLVLYLLTNALNLEYLSAFKNFGVISVYSLDDSLYSIVSK